MNPYTAVRKTLIILGLTLKLVLLVVIIAGAGLIGSTYLGPWGWVLGPGILAGFLVAIAALTVGLYSFCEWWKERERAYRRRARTAHGEGSNPAA